jgi:hypothetical protein
VVREGHVGVHYSQRTSACDLQVVGGVEGEILYRIGLACLNKIARVSGSPKSSEPAELKNSLMPLQTEAGDVLKNH